MPTTRNGAPGLTTNIQLSFGGAVNSQIPSHLLPDDTVQSATDIDFSLERGAATVRRGVVQQISTLFQHYTLFKSYAPSIVSSVIYSGYKNAGTFGIGFGTIGGAFTSLITSGFNAQNVGFSKHKDFTYIAGAGTSTASYAYAKHDGSSGSATQWILPAPGAPTITLATQGTLAVGGGTYTVTEGTSTQAGQPNAIVGTATITADGTSGRVTITVNGVGAPSNLTTNGGGFTIGNFGIHYVDLAYSNPQNVYRISYDFSVGDSTFVNFLHGELQPNQGLGALSGLPDPSALVSAQLYQGTDTTSGLTAAQKAAIASVINQNFVPVASTFPTAANVFGGLAIPRTNFSFVGSLDNQPGTDPWASIFAVRVVIESFSNSPLQIVQLRNPRIAGDTAHPLNDMNAGYTWWQTYGVADSEGNIVEESAPSAPSTIQLAQHCNAVVVGNHGTGNLTLPRPSGVTHLITYRQGGYTQDAYQVSTAAFTSPYSATTTFTDTVNDIQAISLNIPLTRDVYQISPGTAVDFPGDITVLAPQSWYDRLFIADRNQLLWSMPGKPGTFPHTSIAQVSHIGDQIAAIIPYADTLVVVNRDSVYEMRGNVFEGPNSDWVLQRSGARRGSIAPASAVQTPHGIPLLHYDGLEMYVPGQGVSQAVPWVTEQIGDAFRGAGAGDPAALKGSRVPAINGNINLASAAYCEGKLYIAAATGTSTVNNTIFVLDFTQQKVFWYSPGFATNLYNLYWDFLNNSLIGAGFSGVFQLENNTSDGGGAITSSFKTRAWSVPQDTLVENISLEYAGGPWTVTAIYDSTSTQTVGTFGSSGAKRQYTIPTLGGTVANNIVFGVAGTTTGLASVYGVTFDAIRQPARVKFWREDYFDNGYEGDKLWDVFYAQLGNVGTSTSTVTAVTLVDNIAVMTNTVLVSANGKTIFTQAFPAETYGGNVYSTFTSPQVFQYWESKYQARNLPPKVGYWKTDPVSMDENICDAYTVDIFPNGTVTATTFLDGVAISTATITSSGTGNPQRRQSYVRTLPTETYGRTIFNEYTGTALQHYATQFHLRKEPNRVTSFVSSRETYPTEQRFDNVSCEINPLGNSVLAAVYIDGLSVQTSTFTGTLRDRYVASLPANTYGKTSWVSYSVVGSSDVPGGIAPSIGGAGAVGGSFKYYSESFKTIPEPDRVLNVQTILPPFSTDQYLKTWIVEMNPESGIVSGTLFLDGVATFTNTFLGNIRNSYVVGVDENVAMALQTATAVEARYVSLSAVPFKHYQTRLETEVRPFGKQTWAITYKKIGGASQINFVRFFALHVEATATTTLTSIWESEELPSFYTSTHTLTAGRNFLDRQSFPGGGRGRLWQQRIVATNPIKVWSSSIDSEIVGIKGYSRVSTPGTPQESSYEAYKFSQ